jgi:two-component system NtrC family sensor kinase
MILSRVLLAPFVTVMLICTTLVYFFADNLRDHVVAKLDCLADGHRRLLEQFLTERAAELRLAADSHPVAELRRPEKLEAVLRQLQQASRGFFDLGLFDDQGNHLAYIGPYQLQGKNYARTEWFQAARLREVYFSDVFLGFRNSPHFIVVVRKQEEGRDWFLRATIDTVFFNELVESIRVGKAGEAYVVNREGVFQTESRSGGGLMERDPDFERYRGVEGGIQSFSAIGASGDRCLFAVGRLAVTGWTLVVREPAAEVYAPLLRAVMVAVGMIVAGGGVVVSLAYVLATSLGRQLTLAEVEKRQLGNQLILAGKLAEVGEMSSGVAHEINNPLQIICSEQMLIADLLAEEEKKGAIDRGRFNAILDSLHQIGVQIDRCKQITQGLLKFARKHEPSLREVRLDEFIDDVVKVVALRAEKQGIEIVKQLDPAVPAIVTDPGQLQQVLVNLLNNSVYALHDRAAGQIRIASSRDRDCLALSVTDNGRGIPPEHLEKIFMPFFTTKPVGQGTGLGLSTVYGIVERLGGSIDVASEVDTGSVFTVRLPLAGPERTAAAG